MQKNKENNPKRKKIFLLASLVVLLATPIILYFVLRDQDSEEWYSSDWNYRRSIVLENSSEGDLSNQEILIEINTESLVEDNKMQWDCDDLRILDSDNKTSLDYWIEGGCNTERTQIWVDIPSLPKDGKVIYAYYGNETAPNSEMQWEGNFLMFSDSTKCSEGWSIDSTYDDKFFYGSETAGEKVGSNTHDHGGSIVLGDEDISTSNCEEGCTANMDIDKEEDIYILNIPEEENIPPYTTLLVCTSDDLTYTNQIAYFDSTNFPENWTYMSDLENTFVRGYSIANLSGGKQDHTHEVTSIYSLTQETTEYSNYIGSLKSKDESTFGLIGTYAESASNLPAYQILALAKSNVEKGYGENNMILPVTELPPLGWEYYEELENRIPLTGTDIGKTGGSNTHSHSLESFLVVSNLEDNNGEKSIDLAVTTIKTENTSNIPESITVIYAQRKDSMQITIEDEEELITEEKDRSITGVDVIAQVKTNTKEEGDVRGASTPAATDLLTEGETNPSKVADLTPEFSAIFTDPDTGDTGEYYEVEVNTLSNFTGTVMLDTGKTSMVSTDNGNRSSDISYSGTTLEFDGTTYYWRIKFWDNDDTEGSWSSTSSFTMAQGAYASSLFVDGSSNPIFLNSASPVFSAICEDPDGDNCSAYQIEVNDSSSFTGTEYWDSGKISLSITNSSRSSDIIYTGTPLINSGGTLYWRITLWDTDDISGDIQYTGSFEDSYPSFTFEGLQLEGIQIN